MMGSPSNSASASSSKFVCPNDRQLSLRAKLRSGWCVPRGVSPLTPAEQAAILEVIRRSEALSAVEAARVGRLVERVRALRGPAPPEALPGAPARCRACQARRPLLQALRTCAVCQAHICRRCALPSAPNSDRWLCNVCAETREMWKKSGAWFYRGLPQYTLPERRPTRYGGPGAASGSMQELHLPQEQTQENQDLLTEAALLPRALSGLSLARADSVRGPRASVVEATLGGLRRSTSRGSAASLAQNNGKDNSNNQTGISNSVSPPVPAPPACGCVEVRLLYCGDSLQVTCVRARALPPTDLTGLADPYCCLEMLPLEGAAPNRLNTKTVHKTINPEFNETLTFPSISKEDLQSKTFRITVMDKDKYGCDILGSASLSLPAALSHGTPLDFSLPLTAGEELPDQLARPQILVSLCYSTKRRALAVGILRCKNLPAMDSNGFSDPFVKLHLEPDPCHRKHKTSIKWRNLNPVYNEEFLFDTRPTELAQQALSLTVWDKDYGKTNDFLGSLVIGHRSKGKRLRHWQDCIKFPDHKHEQWHCLTEADSHTAEKHKPNSLLGSLIK